MPRRVSGDRQAMGKFATSDGLRWHLPWGNNSQQLSFFFVRSIGLAYGLLDGSITPLFRSRCISDLAAAAFLSNNLRGRSVTSDCVTECTF